MPEETLTQKVGRLEYIEPNNMFSGDSNYSIRNGIPQPYEDYSFSVNLRVICGNRYDCGLTAEGGDLSQRVLEFSSERGTLSFMDGSSSDGGPGYLTTNFTDISMNDPSTNTRECLGIDNISIKYNSYYFPTVQIRFIDVRGASLMQPSEYVYYNNGNPNVKKDKSGFSTNSDFFKAFFSFPYPLFKLSVKGFYGKEVTYDLSLLSTNIEFNSSTGNFEINTEFVGYLYGMYSDLPFSFLYLAPYIDLYGKNTWEEKTISTKDFWYVEPSNEEGNETPTYPMYTFPELYEVVNNTGEQANKEFADSISGITRTEVDSFIQKINGDVIPRFPSKTKNLTWWSWSETKLEKETYKGFFFTPVRNNAKNFTKLVVFNDIIRFSESLEEYNELVNGASGYCTDVNIKEQEPFKSIYKEAKKILDQQKVPDGTSSAATSVSGFKLEDIERLLSGKIVVLSFHKKEGATKKDMPTLEFDITNSELGTTNVAEYMPLINHFKKAFGEMDSMSPMKASSKKTDWLIFAFILENARYRGAIVNTLDKLNKKKDELSKALEKYRDESILTAVKFKPTIKNIYNMLFAHTDTFMSVFYNTLSLIRSKIENNDDKTRVYKNFSSKGGSKVEFDVNQNTLDGNTSNGGKLPPFTMFYVEKDGKGSENRKIEAVWPGSLNGGENLDEVHLVEAIVNATALDKKSFSSVSPKDNVIERDGNLAPINYYDIMHSDRNPYLDILDEKTLEDENTVKEILKVFVLRCFYSMLSGSYTAPDTKDDNNGLSTATANYTRKAKLIAELEAGNIERAFQSLEMKPTKSFITGLHKLSTDGETLLSECLKDKKGRTIFNEKVGNGGLSYDWISIKDDGTFLYKTLPVGIFTPDILEKYINGSENLKENSDKFLKINDKGTIVNGTYACSIYSGGKGLEQELAKYSSGDFVQAAKLFPNYDKLPKPLSEITFEDGTFTKKVDGVSGTLMGGIATDLGFKTDSLRKSYNLSQEEMSISSLYEKIGNEGSFDAIPAIPSYRKTEAGVTSIFMDPFYYAQDSLEARAYLFLMGVPYGKDKKFFLPEKVENGDYPTLMLLREGAIYWRKGKIIGTDIIGSRIEGDPINYEYERNAILVDVLSDIEKNDPCLGVKWVVDTDGPSNASEGRRRMLTDYFVKWATGISSKSEGTTADVPTKYEIPAPSLDFQTIERFLALWDYEGDVKTLLSYGNAEQASYAPYTSSFANGTLLKEVYNVASDDKLGKTTKEGKIRTDVYLRSNVASNLLSEESKKFLQDFTKFYIGFDTFIDFSCLDKQNEFTTVPKSAISDALSAFVKKVKEANKVSIGQLKEGKNINSSGEPSDSEKGPQYFNSDHLKLAIYLALKNLYDKWLCSRRRESWYFSCDPKRMRNNGIKSDFLRFYYIDTFYHDIGMEISPSLTTAVKELCKSGGFTADSNESDLASVSLLSILSTVAEKAGCSLLALPTTLGLAKNKSDDKRGTVEEVFKAYPYNESVRTDGIESSFVTLYSYEASTTLNVPDDSGTMAYKSDGFDIANTWGEINPLPMFSDGGENSYVVPSFGVTFAKQNQSFFKDIRLSMDDHQVTEFSLRNQLMISYANNRGPRETSIIGQDLYSVFANYSYKCTVSMLGDAQITPLMYFQLNNIPMWRGAYIIISVEHRIDARGFETVFSGQRASRYSLPFKDDLDIPENSATKNTPQSEDPTTVAEPEETLELTDRPLDKIKIEDVKSVVFILDRTNMTTSEKWINGLFSVRVYYNDGRQEDYQDIALTIEPTTGLTGRIEDFTPEQNTVNFSIPAGRYGLVVAENAPVGEEYRDPNDSFYKFTYGRHITISDLRLGTKRCEIITGETDYTVFERGGFKDISFGGVLPIMLYGNVAEDINKQFDKNEIRAVYHEIFNLVRRMNMAKKPLTFLVKEVPDLEDTKIDDGETPNA